MDSTSIRPTKRTHVVARHGRRRPTSKTATRLAKILRATLERQGSPHHLDSPRRGAQPRVPRCRHHPRGRNPETRARLGRHAARGQTKRQTRDRRPRASRNSPSRRRRPYEENNQRQIIVQFSGNLDPRQDLKGLVRLSQGEFTTSIRAQRAHALRERGHRRRRHAHAGQGAAQPRGRQACAETARFTLTFTNTKPQVRFVGKGVILPDADNAHGAVRGRERARGARDGAAGVRGEHPAVPAGEHARRLAGDGPRRPRAVAQDHSAHRAGARPLDALQPRRHGAHAASTRAACSSCTLSLAPGDALWDCPGKRRDRATSRSPNSRTRKTATATTPPTGITCESYYEEETTDWNERDNPCKPSYYRYQSNTRAARNLLASNIGLIAKRGSRGKLLVVSTALDSGEADVRREDRRDQFPEPGAGKRPTDGNGMRGDRSAQASRSR